MWLLSFIPDAFLAWIINTILIVGIVGFAASFFFGFVVRYLPAIAPYRMLVQIVSIILLVSGVYFKGGYSVEMSWRARVADLEAKIAISEEKSKQANEDLEKVRTTKVQVIREKQIVIQEKIKNVQVNIDSQCKITTQTIDILNEAAKGTKK
jgi:hypothetical protein